MISSSVKFLFSAFYGRRLFQPFFSKLYSFALRGMNYGLVGSGEDNIIKTLELNSNKPVVFDIGANVGEYSEILLKRLPRNVQIYAFEPSLKTFQKLADNLKGKAVVLVNAGLGKSNEKVKLYFGGDLSTLASVFDRNVEGQTQTSFEEVQLYTLDSFCKTNDVSYIDFLKIDVEGNELNVLMGAKEMLKNKKIKQIQFEFGGSQIDARVFFKDIWTLLSPQYHIYRVLKDGIVRIDKYHERLEIFSYSNYIAKLK